MTVFRQVSSIDGMWRVVHPFTEEIEFTTADQALAEAVAQAHDEHDPVAVGWLLDKLFSVPLSQRRTSEWVLSTRALATIRKVKDPTGQYVFQSLTGPDNDFMFGLPVAVDESAVGVSLRQRVAA